MSTFRNSLINSIMSLFIISWAQSVEAYKPIQSDEESSLRMQRAREHLLKTKQFIGEFYAELARKTSVNVEKEFRLNVSPDNAAEVMAFALLMRGDAPQTHKIFTEDYDPYSPYFYPKPCQKIYTPPTMPETEEGVIRLRKLNHGLATHWPEFLKHIKTANKARKQKQPDNVNPRTPSSKRRQLSYFFQDEPYDASVRIEPAEVKAPPSQKRKFAEHMMKAKKNAGASYKRRQV